MATIIIKDKNLVPQNIRDGVTILKVTGTYEGQRGTEINNQDKTVSSSTSDQTVTCDSGYTGLGTVTVNKYTLDSKTVDASTSQQVITSDADGLSSVTVKAVDASIDPNILPQNIKLGVTILGVEGISRGGILDHAYITPDVSTKSYYPTPGEYNIGFDAITVYGVDASIDSNIIPDNIKAGVTILGVTGNYVGDSAEINNQKKSVTPTRTLQRAVPDSGYTGMDEVTVYGVTSSIDSNITAGNIKSGVNILGVTGTYGGGGTSAPDPYYAATWGCSCLAVLDSNHFVNNLSTTIYNSSSGNDKYAFAGLSGEVFHMFWSYGSQDGELYTFPTTREFYSGTGGSIYTASIMSGDTLDFWISSYTGDDCVMTLAGTGVEMSTDSGSTWSSSVVLGDQENGNTDKSNYNIKLRNGGDVHLNMRYRDGSQWSTSYYLIYIDEMPPMPEPMTCQNCEGTGIDPNTGETCETCWGEGVIW